MNTPDRKANVISYERGMELIKEGYFALDPHCHSAYSYDVPDVKEINPEFVVKRQKDIGLRQILTDHDTLNGYNYLKHRGYKIIPAVELTFKPRIIRKIVSERPIQTMHVNIFGLNNHDLIVLREIAARGDLDELIKYLKQNDLDWMYNHPFYHEKKEHLNWKVIPGLAKDYFDVIELNSTYSKGLNDICLRLANNLDKGTVASSDSHTGNPGRGFIVAEGKNFKDFWENVKDGKSYIMRKDMGTWDIVRESSTIVNQAVRSSRRPRAERNYTPSTDIEYFDDMLKSMTSGRWKNALIIKKVVQMIFQSFNYTAGPILMWKLHVTKDEEKAQNIRNKIHAITKRIKDIESNIKIGRNKRFLNHNTHNNRNQNHNRRLEYYGRNLVKNRKIA